MEIKYCPYCGDKLIGDEQICSKCGSEISFVDSGALDNDNFEELKIEHEGIKLSKITFFVTTLCSIICFFFPIFFLSVQIDAESYLAPFIFIQLLIYVSLVIGIIAVIYAIRFNLKCKRHSYKPLGYFTFATWIGIFGLSFGLLFTIIVVTKLLFPQTNTPPSSSIVNAISSWLAIRG